MSQKKQYVINSVNRPLKGMNRIDERWNMHPQFYYDLLNGYVTKSASGQTLVKQRWGLKKISTGALNAVTAVTSFPGVLELLYWKYNSVFVACDNNELYSLALSDGIWTARTTEAATRGRSFAEYGANLLKSDSYDSDSCAKFNTSWTKSILSSDSTLPTTMQKILVHNGRVLGMGNTSADLITGSKKDGATDTDGWSVDNDWFQLNVSKHFQGQMNSVGMRSLFKDMVLFVFDNGALIFNITSDPTKIEFLQKIELPMLTKVGSGAVTPLVCAIGSEWVFASKPGLKALNVALSDGRLDQNDLSKNIKNLWNDLVDYATNAASGAVAIATYFPPLIMFSTQLKQLWVSIPQRVSSFITGVGTGGGEQNIVNNPTYKSQVLIYSLDFKEFVGRFEFPINITSMYEHPVTGDIYIGCDNGYLYRYDEDTYYDEVLSTGAAGNTNITFSFKPSYIGNDTPDNFKALKSLSVIAETNQATDLTLNYNIQPIADKSDAAFSAESETVSLASGAGNNYDYDLIGRGKLIDFEITHAVAGSRVTLGQVTINCDLEGKE